MKTTICALMMVFSLSAFADKKADKKPAPAKDDPMAKMMAEYEKAAIPGPEHKALAEHVGSWTTASKMWMEPGKPPMEAQGSEEVKSLLGGRFVEAHYSGQMMGKPFEGIGVSGFDNMKKKYVMTWMDSMGTTLIYAEGTGDAKNRTYTGEEMLPGGAKRNFRWVVKIESKDKHTMEMWAPGMDGKDAKQMEIVYTRK